MRSRTITKQIVTQKYFLIATVGFILWIGETAFFGWNTEPHSTAERTLDFVSALLIGWGIIGDILKGVEIHKKSTSVFNETTNITTKKVEVIGDNQTVKYVFGTTEKQTRELLAARKDEEKS